MWQALVRKYAEPLSLVICCAESHLTNKYPVRLPHKDLPLYMLLLLVLLRLPDKPWDIQLKLDSWEAPQLLSSWLTILQYVVLYMYVTDWIYLHVHQHFTVPVIVTKILPSGFGKLFLTNLLHTYINQKIGHCIGLIYNVNAILHAGSEFFSCDSHRN